MALSPQNLFLRQIKNTASTLWCLFSIYALLVSIATWSFVATAYSIQYVVYVVAGWLLIRGYLQHAKAHKEIDIAKKLLLICALIYAVAVIISVWTGPIYPMNVLWYNRIWGGEKTIQGLGFATSSNGAGITLVFFAAIFCYVCTSSYKHLGSLITILALLMTISRGAFFGFLVGTIALLGLDCLRKKMKRDAPISLLLLVLAVGIFISLNLNKMNLILYGYTSTLYSETFTGRTQMWLNGLQVWQNNSFSEQSFGVGFHGTAEVNTYGSWETPHNLYISMLVDFGIVGFVLFVFALVVFLLQLCSAILRTGGTGIQRASLVAMTGVSAHCMAGDFLYSPTLMSMVLLLVGFSTVNVQSPNRSGVICGEY